MGSPTVVVAGAGIGGLATAAALHRAGIEPVVLERRDALGEIGAGITLWPNALAALDHLGVGDEARRRGGRVAGASLRRPDGSWLKRITRADVRAILGEVPVCIPRPELVELLRDATTEVEIRLGVSCTGFEQDGARVKVQAADGSAVEADVLVAADGIHSAIASGLHPRIELTYAGYTNWRGIADYPLTEEAAAQSWGRGGHFGCLPLGGGRTYWFATTTAPRRSHAPDRELELVKNRFGTWHSPIPEILASTDPDAVLRHDILDRTALPSWGVNRVALIGDAAHPMRPHLAQGGGQAIEDAVVLAVELAGRGPVEAITRYDERRRQRVVPIVHRSANIGRAVHVDSAARCWVRDWVTSMLPTRFYLRRMAQHGTY